MNGIITIHIKIMFDREQRLLIRVIRSDNPNLTAPKIKNKKIMYGNQILEEKIFKSSLPKQ